MAFLRSLVHIKNNKGPKRKACGRPKVPFYNSDLTAFVDMNFPLLLSYLGISRTHNTPILITIFCYLLCQMFSEGA